MPKKPLYAQFPIKPNDDPEIRCWNCNMLASYILEMNGHGRHSLTGICEECLRKSANLRHRLRRKRP